MDHKYTPQGIKFRITEALVKQLELEDDLTVDQAYLSWWVNLRDVGGFRLTDIGFHVFSKILELDYYSFPITHTDYGSRFLVQLDKRLQNPYYIIFKKRIPQDLIFFNSQEAMLANLYGNLNSFLESYIS